MNAVVLLALVPVALGALWLAQTLLLWAAGEFRFAPLLRHGSTSPVVRWWMKVALQAMLLGVLFGYPALIGEDPIGYHRDRLHPASPFLLIGIVVVTALAMTPVFVLNAALGWVEVGARYRTAVVVRKVAQSLLTPLPLAFVEEAVFRGLLLDQLLRALPGSAGMAFAIVASAAVFASVHFLRVQKRVFLPALGLFGLGVILGCSYVIGGYSYWLPVGIHAGGVLFVQLSRPFVVYRGPAWLIGYSSYPVCGLFGMLSMAGYVTAMRYAYPAIAGA